MWPRGATRRATACQHHPVRPVFPSWPPHVVDHDGGLAAIGETPVAVGTRPTRQLASAAARSPHPSAIEIPRDVAPVARIARPASPPPRRSRRRRSAPRRWAASAIPAVRHVEAMLQTRREDGYTRTSRVVMRGIPPCWWAVRSPVLCPVSGARRGAGAPAQRIDSRYVRRVTRRSTPSLTRMLLR